MDRKLNARVMREASGIHEVRETNRNRCEADQAVQNSDELRHLRHLYAPREDQADRATDQQCCDEFDVVLCNDAEYRCQQSNRHTDDAVPVAAARSLLVGKAAECEDEKNRRRDVRDRDNARRHGDEAF